ncbi:3-oxoacyl-[acyl-carrier-protein] reductase [Pseudoalteromonas sp. OOF1S-7]|uniref:3-oxoacyl-[acyl-carrier-protein] reductase n=1 Tax=Pseudoalteromonas sp. OOF1S-7 TaxID=2917757 RepID=UPI001EF53631|nr:3-oxoacyl-[acyl-carrier-protein] reductase [Pseudoalteromonas sp. OOF1S-7]MCG7536687.1 3-oxoacyl-[acyl-carrier-protein] reductase [Pseudoalteromonas sp. OOF1S-7]
MLQGKYALVTGGNRGIGKGIVEDLAKQGANVVFTYRSNAEMADDLVETLKALYPEQQFVAACCDIASEQDIDVLFEQQIDPLEKLDILVSNAGITADGMMITMESEVWNSVITTNLTGSFLLAKKAGYKMLLQREGSIVMISSVAGVYGNAGQTNYAASKAGLIGMAKSLSKELAPRNIRVNVVAPGFIETDMTGYMSDKERKEMKGKIAMKRMGTVDDVANVVTFLASEKAQYVTGQTLVVDGGLVI